jgi:hypothetical protein
VVGGLGYVVGGVGAEMGEDGGGEVGELVVGGEGGV